MEEVFTERGTRDLYVNNRLNFRTKVGLTWRALYERRLGHLSVLLPGKKRRSPLPSNVAKKVQRKQRDIKQPRTEIQKARRIAALKIYGESRTDVREPEEVRSRVYRIKETVDRFDAPYTVQKFRIAFFRIIFLPRPCATDISINSFSRL